jgi:tetratricopeptide (TPR) repeat protein
VRLLVVLALTVAQTSPTIDPTPLLTYTDTQHLPPATSREANDAVQNRLSQVKLEIQKDPAPEANCAQTLGAKRFATVYDELGGIYANLSDDEKAAEAFSKAISCSPRAVFLHAELANSLLDLGRYEQARAELQLELTTTHPNFGIHSLTAQLDFIAERWSDVVGNARAAVSESPDDTQAIYWECFLLLAQKRMGAQHPQLATHKMADAWPYPVLEFLLGKIGENDLVADVKSESDGHRRREILTEALFYTGEQHLAAQQTEEAKLYFTAAVKLDVEYFIEHHLAMAELDKLRHRQPHNE